LYMHLALLIHQSSPVWLLVIYRRPCLSVVPDVVFLCSVGYKALLEARCPVWVIKPSSLLPWKSRSVMAYGPASQMVSRAVEFISSSFCA